MAACPPKGCQPALKNNYFLTINGTAFQNVSARCDPLQGIVLMTDDAGLVDVNDPAMGAWLDTDNRTQTLFSATDVLRHFSPCSCIARDLLCYFGLDVARGSRPRSIIVGYVDPAETLTEGYLEITKCPVCATQFIPTTCKSDGTTWIDTPEYLDFLQVVDGVQEHTSVGMTYEASLAFGNPFTDTSSYGAQAAAKGIDMEYVVASYTCDFIRDADCDAVLDDDGNVQPINYYNNSALNSAAISASYASDLDYCWTKFRQPHDGNPSCETGRFLDETTGEEMEIGVNEVINATTVNGYGGDLLAGVTRAYSGFFNTERGIRYLESLEVTRKNFGDVWFKELLIRLELENTVIDFMDSQDCYGITDAEAFRLAQRLRVKMIAYIRNGIIDPREYDWEANGYDNILVNGRSGNGEGFVIVSKPVNQIETNDINQRNGNVMGVCFIVNTPQHRIDLNICETVVNLNQEV